MSDESGVISIIDRLNKAEQEPTPVVIQKPARSWENVDAAAKCEHTRYAVDEVLPKVTCAGCGEVMDPYYALRLVGEYFKKRDWRWEAIREAEKEAAQMGAAQLHRLTREYEAKHAGVPIGSYATQNADYIVRQTPNGWEVAWRGAVIRKARTLSAARTFVRNHVRANWGKEPARTIAQGEAAQSIRLTVERPS